MKNKITGRVFVLGDNVDTDQIIPAEHLIYSMKSEEERKLYGKYALSGVPAEKSGLPSGNIPFIDENNFESEYKIIIGGKNFGCGSSREHAPFALQQAGVEVVVAESYARIFYRNAVDGGFIIPVETEETPNLIIKTGDIVEVDLESMTLKIVDIEDKSINLKDFREVLPIIESGGLFKYAGKMFAEKI